MPAGTFLPPGLTTSDVKITSGGTDNYVMTAVDGETIQGEANLTFSGSALTVTGTLTVGANTAGHDVKFFGDTASAYILWDTSADKLLTAGGAVIDIVKDKLLIGGTAVTTTAAELNVLDAVTAGTVSANLGVVVDGNKDIGSFRNVTLTGDLIVASGKGIDFSATGQLPGMTSELFDDYEEGLFTPGLGDDDHHGTSDGQGYTTAAGSYTKVGRVVHFRARINVSDAGTLTSGQTAVITGLPFAASSTSNYNASVAVGLGEALNLNNAGEALGGRIDEGLTWVYLSVWDATGGMTAMTIGEFGTGHVIVAGTYEV